MAGQTTDNAIDITGKTVDPLTLTHELQAAGIPAVSCGISGDVLWMFDATGEVIDPTPQAEAVVAAHVPPPRFVDYVRAQLFDAKIVTTSATPSELWRTTLPPQTAYLFTAQVVGVDAGNGAALRYEAKYSVKRLNAGVVQIGAPVVICDQRDPGASAWVIAPAMAGNDVILRVTGAAGRTVDWAFRADAALYAPAGLGA